MAQTFTVASHAYSVGTIPFGPFAINAGVSGITVGMLRDPSLNLPGVVVVRITAICSFDGGVTWNSTVMPSTEIGNLDTNPAIDFGMDGDPTVVLDKFGQPILSTTSHTSITSPCHIKGQLVVTDPLTTTITITLT